MYLADLKPGGLYVLLFIRDFPPREDDFHWALYLHEDAVNGGTKYHIRNEGEGWMTDYGHTLAILKEFLLVGHFRIADIPSGWEQYVDQILRSYDDRINVPGNTCKVWLFWVLEALRHEKDGHILLKCNDLTALEREIKDWGNVEADGAAMNKQPRALAASQICGL